MSPPFFDFCTFQDLLQYFFIKLINLGASKRGWKDFDDTSDKK